MDSDEADEADDEPSSTMLALTDGSGVVPAEDDRKPDDDPGAGASASALAKELEKNQTCYMMLNVCDITMILSMLEPAALSELNLRKVIKRGQRLENSTRLLELLEFLTNESAQSTINREYRQLGSLVRFLAGLNEKFGRRARDLTLPASWDHHGVYTLQHFGETVFIQHRFVESLRARVYPPPPSATGLFIELNYSELRATLKQEGSSYNQPIILLFPHSIGQNAVFTPKKGHAQGSSSGRSRSTAVSSLSPGTTSSVPVRPPSARASSRSSAPSVPMEAAFAPPPPSSAGIRRRYIGKQPNGALAITDISS